MVEKTSRHLDKPNYSQFCVQIQSVGCHGNKGRLGPNFNDAVKLYDPENPLFGANVSHLSLTVPEL